MVSSSSATRCGAILFACLVCFTVIGESVGASFVSSTRISQSDDIATIAITFNCNVTYLDHDPAGPSDQIRIHLETTSICSGVTPEAANTRDRLRPNAADDINLVDIEYDGTLTTGSLLRLNFNDRVVSVIEPFSNASTIMIRLLPADAPSPVLRANSNDRISRQVQQDTDPEARYVINLQSSNRPPASADLPAVNFDDQYRVFVAQADIDGQTWYRVRVGYFRTAELAARELARLRVEFPSAWIDRIENVEADNSIGDVPLPEPVATPLLSGNEAAGSAALMVEAKRAMTAGELSKAIQIYTKILQQPAVEFHPHAQEYLALARERNGQIAHAKAEYQRFLAEYPDDDGAPRVRQRLAALVAQARPPSDAKPATTRMRRERSASAWSVRSFFTQYYRRDANQVNDLDEIVSQSALYSDINLDARRRGQRYDFMARFNGGYRYDFLDEDRGSGNEFRVSYAYADLADTRLNLQGRLGRQSRHSGGVLGRFDGLNVTYQLGDTVRLETVAGKPVHSVNDGVDDERAFYGLSSTFSPFPTELDFGVFFLQQSVGSMTDRQAVGAEVRYFDDQKSLWAMVDYDTSFDEVGSMFLQGSWRVHPRMTLTGVVDRRRSPYLSASNALIGQTVADFDELTTLFTEDEIRQLALDRAAGSTTLTLGLSSALTPRLQLNVNASDSTFDATPASGGILGTPASFYRYLSTDLIASSLIREGDVAIVGLRFAESDTNDTLTVNLDTRFPIGSTLRLNPRLRVDYREVHGDQSTQWTYTPGLRLRYRKDRGFRIDFETGVQLSSRELTTVEQDRRSWFVNVGYQWFF